MTDDVSRVAAPCALSVVEGDEVDMGLLCVIERGVFDCLDGTCFFADAGESETLGAAEEVGEGPLCWV